MKTTILVVLLATLVATACGAKEGRYARFTSWGDAHDWDVWRQSDGRYFFRSTGFWGSHVGSCVDGGRVIELDGRVVRDTLEGDFFRPGVARYATRKAAWAELLRDFFDKRQVEQALRHGSDRPRPRWLHGFEKCNFEARSFFR